MAMHDLVSRVSARCHLRLGLLSVGAAVVICCVAWTTASASAAPVSGLVFNDFNTDGVFNTNPDLGAVDVGVGGLTVRAFTGPNNTLVGTARTRANGTYRLVLPNARVRLELDVVRPWWPSRNAAGFDVRFVDASSRLRGENFAVHQINQYSVDNPDVFWPLQWMGPVVSSSDNFNNDAIRGLPFFRTEVEPILSNWDSEPALSGKKSVVTFGKIGTVFGLAIDQRNGDLYAGAYYKRFAGLLGRRTGTIYRITPSGDVSDFANLNAGPDAHPTSTNISNWVQCAGNRTTPPNPATCDLSWTSVGKVGLGSVAIDPSNTNLYTVNLFDKSLYRVPLDPSRRHARAAAVRVTPIPNPNCPDTAVTSAMNWRPFAAGFNRTTGQLYVGGVCSAETTQNRANLRAVVYRVSNPATAPTFGTPVLNFPLNYTRAPETGTLLQFCQGPFFCGWQPWPTSASTGGVPPSNANEGASALEGSNADFPQLTAITFTGDRMTLGFRDLIGDMAGACIPGELSTTNGCTANTGYGPMSHGDLLTAAPGSDGTFTLESNGSVGGTDSAGKAANNWLYGPFGPDPGYFYNPSPISGPGGSTCPPALGVGGCVSGAPHPYQGGLLQVPGFAQVVTTSIHVLAPQANGLLWKDNGTAPGSLPGANVRSLENYKTPDAAAGAGSSLSGFAKSNGLGDLDAYMGLAPVQIGNRLWYDHNGNGIQDADEPGAPDVIVELVRCSDGKVVRKTKTDANGEYVFNVRAGECYHVRVPLDQPALHGWEPTTRFAGHDRRIDSNCRDVNGNGVMFVSPRGAGENDFTFDCGFRRIPPPPAPQPPPPQPPGPEPPAPPEPDTPGAVPPSGPLALVKDVVGTTHNTVAYVIIVSNGGPNTVTDVRVCDILPAGLRYVSSTASSRTRAGREVCWHFASLTSGEEQTLHLTARSRGPGLAGTTVNCATARGIGAPPVPNVPGKRVGPVRACTTVHARITRPPPPVVTG